MTGLGVLAMAAVLLVPGPTNRLLVHAGARRGVWRALPLLSAQWLASILAIGTWCTALGLAASAVPWLPALARIGAAAYVLWIAAGWWRRAPVATHHRCADGAGAFFTAALIDPAALACATLVFPPLGAAAAAVLQAYFLFTVVTVPIAAFWIIMGALGAARPHVAERRGLRQRAAALLVLSKASRAAMVRQFMT